MKKILIAIIILILVGGYLFLAKKDQSVSLDTFTVDHCAELKETIFTSIDKHETGRGGSMGFYTINFWEDYFTWNHSDVTESGKYACNNNLITVELNERPVLNTQYEPDTQTFSFDGIVYKLSGPIPKR